MMRMWVKGSDYRTPSTLCVDFRRVVGAIHTCRLPADPRVLSEILGIEQKRVSWLVDRMRRSTNPAVLNLWAHGLPLSASVDLHEQTRVRCATCRQNLSTLPCITCLTRNNRRLLAEEESEGDMRDRPEAPPVRFAPGTVQKIEAMRQRVERGYSVFSSADPYWEDPNATGEYISPSAA